jgi:hypothetical protein
MVKQSVANYQPTLRNISEEGRPHTHRDGTSYTEVSNLDTAICRLKNVVFVVSW